MRTVIFLQSLLFRNLKGAIVPILLGLAFFLIVVGLGPLNPRNIAWLDGGFDPSLHYLAWEFFRNTPWLNPIGMNPNYGLDIASSVVYSDSIPLFAIFFKIFSPYLGEPFQYIGLWLLLCCILQSCFAWWLMKLYINDIKILISATLFFLFSPPMLWRLGEHAALFGHFLIIGSLYLSLRQEQSNRILFWSALGACSFLVNIYIAAPIITIWFADLLDQKYTSKNISARQFSIEFIWVAIVTILVIWQSGYLSMGSGSASGRDYGFRQLNLLSLFNSTGWSYILPPITLSHPGFEGFNYLGLGILLLLPFAIIQFPKNQMLSKSFVSKHLFLIACLFLLTLFAVSNYVSFGRWQFHFSLPEMVVNYAGMLRSSGRIFWPAYYFLMLVILLGIVRGYSRSKAIILLSIALIVQIADTSSGWMLKRHMLNSAYSSEWKSYLSDPLWAQFPSRYSAVLEVPLVRSVILLPEGWQVLAKFAASNKMGTNSVYIGRYDDAKLAAANSKYEAAISSGKYDPNTLYIIDDERVMPVLMHLDSKKDLFAKIDGFNVLAPGWAACIDCAQPPKNSLIAKTYPRIEMGEPIGFGKGQSGTAFLIGVDQRQIKGWGWGYPEQWGVWSEGPKAKVVLPLPKGDPKTLIMDFRAFITASHTKQVVEVLVNNAPNQTVIFNKDQNNQITIDLSQYKNLDYIVIELRLPDAKSPKDLGIGDDIRPLGVGLTWAEFR